MVSRDLVMVGIGLMIGFFIFTGLGRSIIKSTYKLTEAEVKELERKARERVERIGK